MTAGYLPSAAGRNMWVRIGPVGVSRSTTASSLRITAFPHARLTDNRAYGDRLVTGRREECRAIVRLGAHRSDATRSAPALPAGAAAGTCCARRRIGRGAA